MWAASTNGVEGFEWFLVILAFLVDVGAFTGGSRRRRETRYA
jgi:hypothetical protein